MKKLSNMFESLLDVDYDITEFDFPELVAQKMPGVNMKNWEDWLNDYIEITEGAKLIPAINQIVDAANTIRAHKNAPRRIKDMVTHIPTTRAELDDKNINFLKACVEFDKLFGELKGNRKFLQIMKDGDVNIEHPGIERKYGKFTPNWGTVTFGKDINGEAEANQHIDEFNSLKLKFPNFEYSCNTNRDFDAFYVRFYLTKL